RHVTTATNTNGHITTLDHAQLNGNPNAMVFIMPNYNTNGADPTGADYQQNAGVWYNGSRWTIFNQNTSNGMPPNLTFNVLIAPPGDANYFTISCTAASKTGLAPNGMVIDHPATNNKPDALLLVTQNWAGTYNDNSPIVSYSNSKWYISNNKYLLTPEISAKTTLPIGARFNVMVIENNTVSGFPNAKAFMHTTTAENIIPSGSGITFFDQPFLNGNTNAMIWATPNWGWSPGRNAGQTSGPYNNSPINAWYDHPNDVWNYKNGFWSIYNSDGTNLVPGTKFNVVAVNVSSASVPHDLTGFYRGDNGNCGQAYIRQIGNNMYWFGEHPNGSFGHVFSGTISGNTLTGNLWDVPKGTLMNKGNCVYSISADGNTLTLTGGTIGCNVLSKTTLPATLPASRPMQPGSGALTGVWDCNDGAATYVREDGNDFIFFSEAKNNGTRPGFANLYIGKRNGNTVIGNWVDVPKGTHLGSGAMTLRVESDTRFVRVGEANGYGGGVWTRGGISTGLRGFVDMHTHPMVRWGFGEELFYGDVDGNPSSALGSCHCKHNFVVPPLDGSCGEQNAYRNNLVDEIDRKWGARVHTKTVGFPNFSEWPKHNSVLHQQMWVDWIRRAYEGGLRIMVALAVNNHCLADAAETSGPNDDLRSMNIQIQRMREFVGRHDFMEIALTAADVRRIVGANKLVVILGIEMDNIGNFYAPVDRKGGTYIPNPTETQMRNEVDRLYALGVRYIFPIHLTNNAFGGSAIYEHGFNVANKYNTGRAFNVEAVDSRATGITFKLQNPFQAIDNLGVLAMRFTGTVIPGHVMPNTRANYPEYRDPGLSRGHRNTEPLTPLGRRAIRYMMEKGMLIDIDHCSEKAVNEILAIAQTNDYPINSGHNGPRGTDGNENGRTDAQYTAIQRLGGMIGLGHGGDANGFLSALRKVLPLSGNKQVCIGTDVNGLYPLPGPPPANARITYGGDLTRSVMGSRTWDFNTDGMAHYGLLPDYIRSWEAAGMTQAEKEVFFSSAEYFAQMWEKCERRSRALVAGPRVITPEPIGILCPNTRTRGDAEFGGGPLINAHVTIQIVNDGRSVDATIYFKAEETKGDWSTVEQTWTRRLYDAPDNARITHITSEITSSVVNYRGPNAGSEFGACKDGQIVTPPVTGNLIRAIQIIGDTGGSDISSDNDCSCDTQIRGIEFNPINLTLATR
ncbi:MAG TPA: membrane dipeptidase, partial [Saprospiraceae bacterium]|nr:membrane dipeptidase [Saprospiraceae bacterium]HMP15030.1 membrane dipeptidase [Saprospiraceae bacterium]